MKIDDLITEAPMGFLSHAAKKLKSFVPGSTGSRAQGELDVGRVANQWKKDYAKYLGQLGAEGFGSTRTFVGFLRYLKFSDKEIRQVLRGGGVQESQEVYEAMFTSAMIDKLMMRAARVAAAAKYGSKQNLPKEPNPTAPRKPGAVDAAVNIGKKVIPGVAKAAGQVGSKALDYGKKLSLPKGSAPKQRIEPTFDPAVPRSMPTLTKPAVAPAPAFKSSKKAPKMRTKPVTKYK